MTYPIQAAVEYHAAVQNIDLIFSVLTGQYIEKTLTK